MYKGMQCYITPLLHLELTQVFSSFVLFPLTPLIVFLVAMKKCAMPLSEPQVDHRPRSEMVRRSWRIRGAEGVSSQNGFWVMHIRGSLNKFPDFFRMGTFINEITHETLVSFEVISSGSNALVVPFQQLLEGPMEILLCEGVNDLCQWLS